MEPIQFFLQYDYQRDNSQLRFKYCPHCGDGMRIIKRDHQERNVCENCGFVNYRNPLPGVAVLIVEDDHVLLGKRTGSYGKNLWCLPCGFMEYDENFLEAAHREVFEETELRIKIRSVISVATNFLSPELHTLVIILLANVEDGNMHAGDDLSELKWFPLSGPFPEMAFASDRHIIERYYRTRLKGAPIDRSFELLSSEDHDK
jgi:ADP-ribose pyrophosphatase YjhB (NUDIX family)